MAHHLKVAAIRSLFNRSALDDLRDASTPPPTAVDESGRSAQRFELAVRLVQNGVTKTAGVRGQDIYAVTAPVVIETALRVLAQSYRRSGARSAFALQGASRTTAGAINARCAPREPRNTL